MRRKDIERQLAELREDQSLIARLQQELARWQDVSVEKVSALETLRRLDDVPFADSSTLFEITELLGVSDADEGVPSGVGEETLQLGQVPPGTLLPGMAEPEDVLPQEELSRYQGCQTILDIAAVAADDGDGDVPVLYVSTVMRALGMVNPEWKNIRKQAWGEVYKALDGADEYEFCGKGSGRFRRVEPPVQSETVTLD